MGNEHSVNKNLKLIAKSSFIVLIGIAISKILVYIYRVIIARQFGPDMYGIFSLASMVVSWFAAFFAFGLHEGILRYVSIFRGKKDARKIRYVFGISSSIMLVSSIIGGILLFLLSGFISAQIFHNTEIAVFLRAFSILVPLTILSGTYLSLMRAYEMIGWYFFIFNIAQNVLKVFILILLVIMGIKSSSPIIASYLLGIFGMLIMSYLVARYKIPGVFAGNKTADKLTSKNRILSELAHYSFPIMFTGIFSIIFYWLDSFAIGYFRSVAEVGYYNAAAPIAMLLLLAPELFMQLFFPLIAKEYYKRNYSTIKELSKQVGKWIFTINLPIFLLIILFPGTLINILFGKEYLVAVQALRILSVGALVSSIFVISQNIISMAGKSRLLLYNIIITTALNIILNIMLVPTFGINGAALSASLSFIVLNAIMVFEAKHYMNIIPLRRKMLKILLVSLIPTALLILAKNFIVLNLFTIILLGIFFIALYAFLMLATGCLDRNDAMIIETIKKYFAKKGAMPQNSASNS